MSLNQLVSLTPSDHVERKSLEHAQSVLEELSTVMYFANLTHMQTLVVISFQIGSFSSYAYSNTKAPVFYAICYNFLTIV